MSDFLQNLRDRAMQRRARVVLADSLDPRSITAASELVRGAIATPVLIGAADEIREVAESVNVSLRGVECIEQSQSEMERYAIALEEKRRHKGLRYDEALASLKNPLVFAGMMLESNEVQCCVAGSTSSTAAVLRAALQTISLKPGIQTLSSYFLMIVRDRVLAYADCAVVPYPTADQLSDIAASTAANYLALTGTEARVAFLSFSTKGSAEHASITTVREATRLFHERHPDVLADGEVQADVAIVASVAQRKAPNSTLQGNANVLVFPNLDAGNIAYKLTERLAGATALGPIIQGLSKPYCDLSRGCSVEDIVNTACISILMSVPS